MTLATPLLTPDELASVRREYRGASPAAQARLPRPRRSSTGSGPTSCAATGSWSPARRRSPSPAPTCSSSSTTTRSSSSAAGTACCAPSTTSAATAARPWPRSRAARSSASSARTTPGSTTSTARSSGPSTPTTSTTSRSRTTAWPTVRLDTWQGFIFLNLDGRGRAAARPARRPRRALGPVRLLDPAPGEAHRVRGQGQLEVHRRELQRVLPLPGRPPAAQQADAVRPGRRLRPERGVAGRLDGAGRRRRDDVAGRRRRRGERRPQRPPADAGHHARPTSAASTTTSSGRRPSCRSTRTTCSSTGSCRSAPDRTTIVCDWLFEAGDDGRARTSTRPTRSPSGT